MHPVVIISMFNKAMKEALTVFDRISIAIDEEMLTLVKTSITTNFVTRWSESMCKPTLQAVRTVAKSDPGLTTVAIKRCARVEKIPGGEFKQSCALSSTMLNKDVTHSRRTAKSKTLKSSSSAAHYAERITD
jgi:T-complex protein 1 subunit gamma